MIATRKYVREQMIDRLDPLAEEIRKLKFELGLINFYWEGTCDKSLKTRICELEETVTLLLQELKLSKTKTPPSKVILAPRKKE